MSSITLHLPRWWSPLTLGFTILNTVAIAVAVMDGVTFWPVTLAGFVGIAGTSWVYTRHQFAAHRLRQVTTMRVRVR